MSGRPLSLWMNGEFVGQWWSTRGGDSRLAYSAAWVASPRGRPISLSLPFTDGAGVLRGPAVDRWFDNLLPDSDIIRGRLAARHRLDPRDTHALLGAIGRDCVGALQLTRDDDEPEGVDAIVSRPLTPAEVAQRLLAVPGGRAFGRGDERDDDLRISIAGAQEKTALLWHRGDWCMPLGNTPTTHIFKLPLGDVAVVKADLSTSVENEWLCLTLLRAMGLPAASCEIGRFPGPDGEVLALIVERFDRLHMVNAHDRAWIARLPQEDCCQVSGTAASAKYESDGGPGVARIIELLTNSDRANADIGTFVRTQLAFWLLAAPDGHAKNFSIALHAGGRYTLTPIYDVLSAWPIIGRGPKQWHHTKVTLAMGIRGTSGLHRHLHTIHPTHWKRLTLRTGVPFLFESMVAMVETLPDALAAVEPQLPAEFPVLVWERVRDGVLGQRTTFLAALAAAGQE